MRNHLTALLLIVAACGGTQTPAPGASPNPSPAPTPDSVPSRSEPLPSPSDPVPTPTDPVPLPSAPWQQAPLAPGDVPTVFMQEWRAAPNRARCAPIAPTATGAPNATARRANFSGGWAVAYDLDNLRSAFGIAGTAVSAADPSYSEWPYSLSWSDGSSVGYGPEGGAGPNQLAYLRITGQECLYNVWSRLGREHLEELLQQLRFVDRG